MHRGGAFPLLRGVTNVMHARRDDLDGDRRHVQRAADPYCDYLGYDEVAHHAWPDDAGRVGCAASIDRQIALAGERARRARRDRTSLVVVSDHGQSTGATFRQRYGYTLEHLIRDA